MTSLPLATTVGAASVSIPDGVFVTTWRSSPSIRPTTAGKSCAAMCASRMERVATIPSNTATKILAQVDNRFFGTVMENKFTSNSLKGLVRTS